MSQEIDLRVHFHEPLRIILEPSPEALAQIKHKLNRINMNITEAITLIRDASTQADKAKTEILAKIAELEGANGTLTPEQQAAVENLKVATQGLDDIIPDVPPAPTP